MTSVKLEEGPGVMGWFYYLKCEETFLKENFVIHIQRDKKNPCIFNIQ